jgi:hypothetical protein
MKLKELEQKYGDKYWGQCVLEAAKKNISRGIKEEMAVQYAMEDHLDYMDKTMKSMGMKAEGEYEEGPESEMED